MSKRKRPHAVMGNGAFDIVEGICLPGGLSPENTARVTALVERSAAAQRERDAARAELAALQQEVIDVCLAHEPKLETCPACLGDRRIEGIHYTAQGPRCYYTPCARCEGRGIVVE